MERTGSATSQICRETQAQPVLQCLCDVSMCILHAYFYLYVTSGADFTKGLKPDFGLKFKTLVLNSGKNVLSQRA